MATSYGIKYKGSYKRLSNGTTTVTISQKNYTGSVTELSFQEEPVVIKYALDPRNIYQPTVGSGCTIKILAQPLTMLELFSEDPQEFKVVIYSGTTGGTITWQGFVNTEIFSEDYSLSKDVPLTIECNDGMKILENTKYLTTGGTLYSTHTITLGQVLSNVLSKLNLSFNYIYTSNDITISGTTTDFFNYLSIPNENFFDESLIAMNCRDVLNSIVGGIGLQMRFRGSNIYIIDPINLHTTTKGKRYDVSPVLGANQMASSIGGYLNISNNEIDWWETGMQLDILPSYGEISVEYDPYNFTDNTYDFNKKENIEKYGAFYNAGLFYPYSGYHLVNTGVTFNNWENGTTGNTGNSIGIQEYDRTLNETTPEYCIWLHKTLRAVTHTLEYSNITQDDNLRMRVTCDVWVHTKTSDNNIYANGTPVTVQQVYIPFACNIGGLWWGSDRKWYVMPENIYEHPLVVREEGIPKARVAESEINDRWTKCSIDVPLGKVWGSEAFLEGQVMIVFFDSFTGLYPQQIWPSSVSTSDIKNIYLKNVKVDFVDDTTGEVIGNKGVKTTFKINSDITNKEGLKIKTTSGTGTYGHSKAALKTNLQDTPGLNITGLSRLGETGTTLYNTSYLILQSAISQYRKPRVLLSGCLDVRTHKMDTDMKLIQDSSYLNSSLKIFTGYTPAFYITNYTYSDRDEKLNVEMIELERNRVSLPQISGITGGTEQADILIGINQNTGTISLSGLSGNTIALEIRITAAAYSSYINCSAPSGDASYSFVLNGITLSDMVSATGATEEDPNISDVSVTTYIFSGLTSGTTCTFTANTASGIDYCGDSLGQVVIEILNLTVTGGGANIAIDPDNDVFITTEDI